MAYNVGGLIEATDYNNFVGAPITSTANTVNAVWSTGNGSSGYGQTAIPQVAIGNTVTASQWATMIGTLNNLRMHQSGTGTTVATVAAGDLIKYKSDIAAEIAAVYTNRDTHKALGSINLGGIYSSYWSSSSASTQTKTFTIRATFATPDAARYFFNAGGELKVNFSAARNGSTTARTDSIINCVNYVGGIKNFAGKSNGGRIGTGGTVVTNDTSKGYWTSTYNVNTTTISIRNASGGYSTDSATLIIKPTGAQGSNASNGQSIDFILSITSGVGAYANSSDAFAVRVDNSVDVYYPVTTALANTWGAVTITTVA